MFLGAFKKQKAVNDLELLEKKKDGPRREKSITTALLNESNLYNIQTYLFTSVPFLSAFHFPSWLPPLPTVHIVSAIKS